MSGLSATVTVTRPGWAVDDCEHVTLLGRVLRALEASPELACWEGAEVTVSVPLADAAGETYSGSFTVPARDPFTGLTRMEHLKATAADLRARGASRSAAHYRRELRRPGSPRSTD